MPQVVPPARAAPDDHSAGMLGNSPPRTAREQRVHPTPRARYPLFHRIEHMFDYSWQVLAPPATVRVVLPSRTPPRPTTYRPGRAATAPFRPAAHPPPRHSPPHHPPPFRTLPRAAPAAGCLATPRPGPTSADPPAMAQPTPAPGPDALRSSQPLPASTSARTAR